MIRWKRQLLVEHLNVLKKLLMYICLFRLLLLIQLIPDLPGIKAVIPYLYHCGIITAGKRTFQYRAATNRNKLSVSVRSNFSDMSLNEFKGVI